MEITKINSLLHPTETPSLKFSLEDFYKNSEPKIMVIGTWLRKLSSIYFLNTDLYKRVILESPMVHDYLSRELDYYKMSLYSPKVDFLPYQSNEQYDNLLKENIVFLDVIDSSANNIIIEFITRNTPILVNYHPAVVEYLGSDYPFYYRSIQEAIDKLQDKELIPKTFNYLQSLSDKKLLTGEYFYNSFINSEIYKNLDN